MKIPSPCGRRTASVRESHDLCTISVNMLDVTAQKSHDLPTTTVQSLYDLRTASVRLCLWPLYDAQYMKSHDDRK